jgi:hypothetical protein
LQKCTSVGESEATAFLEKVAKFYWTAYLSSLNIITFKDTAVSLTVKVNFILEQTVEVLMWSRGIDVIFL